MDYTIEREFFKAFARNGLVSNCLTYMFTEYGISNEPANKRSCYGMLLDDEGIEIFKENVFTAIQNSSKCIDYCLAVLDDGSLMAEIDANIEECHNEIKLTSYLYSLIMPFKEISDVYYPFALVEREKLYIKQAEDDLKEMLLPRNEDDYCYLKAETLKENIQYSNDFIAHRWEIMNLFGRRRTKKYPISDVLLNVETAFHEYAVDLDTILLYRRLDLFKLQKQCGVYLKEKREVYQIEMRVGSEDLAETLINALQPLDEGTMPVLAPNDIMIESANITSKRGRPKRSLRDCLLCEEDKKDKIIAAIQSLVKGSRGKGVAMIIVAAMRANVMTKLTYAQAKEFGDIGSEQGYNKYMRESKIIFTDEEINPIKERIKEIARL